ncbi:conserved hypothetical protein [Ricinus communis]|uniref:Uncharacterized protein n=1 Tax=Ricinus communis TaxID=3988 RepID=B9SH48_RICCO|nr:conserved hypothetical protein [Ricinus communis]
MNAHAVIVHAVLHDKNRKDTTLKKAIGHSTSTEDIQHPIKTTVEIHGCQTQPSLTHPGR